MKNLMWSWSQPASHVIIWLLISIVGETHVVDWNIMVANDYAVDLVIYRKFNFRWWWFEQEKVHRSAAYNFLLSLYLFSVFILNLSWSYDCDLAVTNGNNSFSDIPCRSWEKRALTKEAISQFQSHWFFLSFSSGMEYRNPKRRIIDFSFSCDNSKIGINTPSVTHLF